MSDKPQEEFTLELLLQLRNGNRVSFEHEFVFGADNEQELNQDRKKVEALASAWISLAPEVHSAAITQIIGPDDLG